MRMNTGLFFLALFLGVVTVGYAVPKHGGHKHDKHHHKEKISGAHTMNGHKFPAGHDHEKAYKRCIKDRATNPTSTENCLIHHNHAMPQYNIPDQAALDRFRCCFAKLSKCIEDGGDPKQCQETMKKCSLGTGDPLKYFTTIPPVLGDILRRREMCLMGPNPSKCDIKKYKEKAIYALLQICTYQLTHCKENNIDDATCRKNWDTCLNPTTCIANGQQIKQKYELVEDCNKKSTKDELLQCILDLQDPHLPDHHCRTKVCYEKANTSPATFGMTYMTCMKTDHMKEFKQCIERRSSDPASTENCMMHHNHAMPHYNIPDQAALDRFRCCFAEFSKCGESQQCQKTMQTCVVGGGNPMTYYKTIPPILGKVVMQRARCIRGPDPSKCDIKKYRENAIYVLLQICTYHLTHCKENNIDDMTCRKNWDTCLNPSTCTKNGQPITQKYDLVETCNKKPSKDELLTCILDLKDPRLPDQHCRAKVCYERANASPASFGTIYNTCSIDVNNKSTHILAKQN